MKLLSRTTVYAVRAMLYIASSDHQQQYVPVRKIAGDLQISFHFLAKILNQLTQHNLLTSYRGPNGGIALARSAAEITLMDIVAAMEGEDFFEGCLLQLPNCGDEKPCPMHAYWGQIRDQLKTVFQSTSLEELGRKIKEEGLRLVHCPES
ncbi:MAG: Rrf2 family transcriptional regulator [Calditrichaeota bacterium]|nr:MAG: Rrf2 family transcriptional regulator [Calditrichota bacterium]